MIETLRPILCCAALALAATLPASAQKSEATPADKAREEAAEKKFKQLIDSIEWKSEGSAPLGGMATLNVPSGFRFTGTAGTVKMLEANGNLPSGSELGYITPQDMSWFAVFQFEGSGYVKDDEKDKLDAAAILKQLREGQAEGNKERAKRGKSTLDVLGWHTPPFYNPQTHNLEWAIRLRSSEGGESINYKTKLLGRRGVMDVVLACDEAQLSAAVLEYQKLLKGFAYKKEESYAAFTKGDKVAKYGLTGLIVGGGVLALAKTGLLAKFWKFIVAGVVVVGAFIKRIFTGKTQESI